jgi:hypothetical protein
MVRVPFEAIDVVAIPPTASVFAEKFVVDAFWMLNCVGMESVTAPVAPETAIWFAVPASEVTPVFEMVSWPLANDVPMPAPFAYVVVAIHDGTPL